MERGSSPQQMIRRARKERQRKDDDPCAVRRGIVDEASRKSALTSTLSMCGGRDDHRQPQPQPQPRPFRFFFFSSSPCLTPPTCIRHSTLHAHDSPASLLRADPPAPQAQARPTPASQSPNLHHLISTHPLHHFSQQKALTAINNSNRHQDPRPAPDRAHQVRRDRQQAQDRAPQSGGGGHDALELLVHRAFAVAGHHLRPSHATR